jgi:predicted Zn-dependent peptidase
MKDSIKKLTLQNGIPVLYEHRPHVRSVSFRVHLNVGTRHEQIHEHGMAHFIEHMVFKGTENRSAYQIASEIERFGGMLNAYTSKEETVFYANVVDEQLFSTIGVFADMLSSSKMAVADIKHEKGVVLEEIKGSLDTPDDIIWDLFVENLLTPNSTGRRTLGTKESVSAFTQDDVLSFWRSKYVAENMYIGVVGNFAEAKLEEKLNETFGRFPKAGKVSSEFCQVDNIFEKKYKRKIEQSHLLYGGQICDYNSQDRFPIILLNNILGAGMSSRLFQNIREKKGLAYSVYSTVDFSSDHGMFITYAATDPDKTADCKNLINLEFESFRNGDILEAEIDDAKNQLKGAMLLSLEGNNGRLERMVRNFIRYGEAFDVDSVLNKFMAITKDDLVRVAEAYLKPAQMSLGTIGPK